jgi:predicted MPP superfamily phosphohydrolase
VSVVLLIIIALALAVALCAAYGVLIESRWYRIKRYRLNILPVGSGGSLTVLHLSDLHFVDGERRKAAFLASLPPADVTVVTGDFLAEPQAVETTVAALRPARGRIASYFVLGSNDYYVPRPLNYFAYFRRSRKPHRGTRGRAPELVAQLRADGWTPLVNERIEAQWNGIAAEVCGLDDPHIHRDDLRAAPRRDPERFGLAIAHSPEPAPELAALGYDLVVAGHTHGGQVRVPGYGALVNNSLLPRSISRGLLKLGPAYVHISPGMGTSKYAPFRFFCRPEATFLELGQRSSTLNRSNKTADATAVQPM